MAPHIPKGSRPTPSDLLGETIDAASCSSVEEFNERARALSARS